MAFTPGGSGQLNWLNPASEEKKTGSSPVGGPMAYNTQNGFSSPPPPLGSATRPENYPSNYYPQGTPQTANSTWGSPSNPLSVNGSFRYGSAGALLNGDMRGVTGRTPPGIGQRGGPEAPLAGPGYGEELYKEHGKDLINTPSASEDLYSKGVAGSNPYYDFAQEQAIKSINDSSAMRGNFNSSYAQNLIGKTVADIRGQQAHELGMLAGQADEGKRGRYDSSFKYAGDAQDQMEDRANKGLDYEFRLGEGRSGLVNDFYRAAGEGSRQAQMAAIEAMLKKSGLTAAEAKQQADQAMAAFEVISKFYNPSGGGSGSGSGISTPGTGGGGGGGDVWYV